MSLVSAAKLICRQEVEFPSSLGPDYKEKSAYFLMLPDVPTEKGIKQLMRLFEIQLLK